MPVVVDDVVTAAPPQLSFSFFERLHFVVVLGLEKTLQLRQTTYLGRQT